MPMSDWRVHLREHHEGYISVEQFDRNRECLEHNRTNAEGSVLSGPAREGLALLQGLLLCGCCTHVLTVRYQGNGGIYPTYLCSWMRRDGLATKDCISVRSDLLDDAICEEVFKALQPAELELALTALKELEQRDQAIMRQWQMRIERAQYEAALAERRYEESDPSNRLVTGTLERRWNEALTRLEQIKAEATQFQSQKALVATPEQKAKVLALAQDLPRLWRATTTQAKDRKRILRLLIRDITVEKLSAQRQVILHIRWQGGVCTDTTVNMPLPMAERLRYPEAIVDQVKMLAQRLPDAQIADQINREGKRNTHGKPFTPKMIGWIRWRHKIPPAQLRQPGELTVKEAAARFGVSIGVVHYWIKRNVLPARRSQNGVPLWITLDEAKERELRSWVCNSKRIRPHHSETSL